MKTLNDYFTMNYRMEIVEDKDEGGFVVSFPPQFLFQKSQNLFIFLSKC